MVTVTLVRDDMHLYLGIAGIALAVAREDYSAIVGCYLPCLGVSLGGWLALRLSDASCRSLKMDATLLRYAASLSVWAALAIMTCHLVLGLLGDAGLLKWWRLGATETCARWSQPKWWRLGGASRARCLEMVRAEPSKLTRQVVTALLLALGVGAQPILLNFTSGLLLVLFRPFRVGDDVRVAGKLFRVDAITAFFVRGTDFMNVHVNIANNAILSAGSFCSNYSANGTFFLELGVHVGSTESCARVRDAMNKAAAAFDARLPTVIEQTGVPLAEAREAASRLGKCAVYGPQDITGRGVKWMLMPLVPETTWVPSTHLGNECILNSLHEANVRIYESSSSSE
jgi:hypothetical protein